MVNANQEYDMVNTGSGRNYDGGVGAIVLLIVAVGVLWFLSGGNHRGGHDGYAPAPYAYGGYGNGCGPCVQPTFKDESNYEEESHLKDKLCFIDRDVIEQGCKDREAIYCDGSKTREYIAHLQERADDKAYNALAMSNMQKDNTIQTLQLMGDFNGKLACLAGEVEKGFCKTDNIISALSCELPKRQPVFAECVTPNTHHIDCDHDCGRGRFDRDFPRRGGCNDCNEW